MKRLVAPLRSSRGNVYTVFEYKNLEECSSAIFDSVADAIVFPIYWCATRKLRKLCKEHRQLASHIQAFQSDIKAVFAVGIEKKALFNINGKLLIKKYGIKKELLQLYKFPQRSIAFYATLYDFVIATIMFVICLLPVILIIPLFFTKKTSVASNVSREFTRSVALIVNDTVATITDGVRTLNSQSSTIRSTLSPFLAITRELSTTIFAGPPTYLSSLFIVFFVLCFSLVGLVSLLRSCHKVYNEMRQLQKDALEQMAKTAAGVKFIARIKGVSELKYNGKSYFLYDKPAIGNP